MSSFCVRAEGCNEWPASSVLAYGWLTLFNSKAPHFTWLANPGVFVTWLLVFASTEANKFRLRNRAIAFGMISFFLAALFWLFGLVVDNEGGVATRVISFEMGYWLWLTSMMCACASAFLLPASGKPSKAV
jgi:hypothetical protein